MKSPVNTFQEYQMKKHAFITKFSSKEAWGDWVSQTRVSAFSEILEYLDEAEETAEGDPSLKDCIMRDNVDILMGNMIAMPRELKESMAVSSNSLPWSNYSSRDLFGCLLFTFKTKQRISSSLLRDFVNAGLNPFTNSVPMEDSCDYGKSVYIIHDVPGKTARENVEFKLRRLRHCLYRKSKTHEDVTENLEKYKTEVTRFTTKFCNDLSSRDLLHWKRKIQITEKDLRKSLESSAFPNQVSAQRPFQFTDEAAHVGQALQGEEEQEELVYALPDVPSKEPEPFDPDEEIQEKLLKLKLFNRAWLGSKEEFDQSQQLPDQDLSLTEHVDVTEHVDAGDERTEGVQHNVKAVDVSEVHTESDRQEFNDWYESELEKRRAREPLTDFSSTSSFSAHFQEISSSSDPVSASASCACMCSSSQQLPFQLNQAQLQAFPNMFLQAIFVMLVAMSRFLHCKLENPAPPCPAIDITPRVTPSASSTDVEFQDLIRMSMILSSHWVTWFTVSVYGRVLAGLTVAREFARNLVKKENWLKVRDIFLAHEQ